MKIYNACSLVVAGVLAAATAGGCSSSTKSNPPPDGGGSSSGGGSSGGGGSSSSSSSGGFGGSSSGSSGAGGSSSGGVADAGLNDNACAAMTTAKACVQCCQQVHPAGIAALVMEIQACACVAGGPCATPCATEYCKDGTYTTVGDACNTCISGSLAADGGGCLTPVLNACQASADCTAYLGTCGTGCNGLP